jgi:hypothetical protein
MCSVAGAYFWMTLVGNSLPHPNHSIAVERGGGILIIFHFLRRAPLGWTCEVPHYRPLN